MRAPLNIKVVAAIAGLCLPQAATADTIRFSDGAVYGKILAETVSGFRFRMNCTGRIVLIWKASIIAVQRNNRCAR